MPVVDEMEVLETVRRISPETPVLVITAFGNVETAVEAMKRGAFDFIGKLFQLNVGELHVPPLRERPEDIPFLVEYFIRELDAGKEMVIPPGVMEELGARPWPGNVRELRNACERIAILSHGREASIDDLPPASGRGRVENPAVRTSLDRNGRLSPPRGSP
jgi:DNA-binding NtrC family response regulator